MDLRALASVLSVVALSCGCAAPPAPPRAALGPPPALAFTLRSSLGVEAIPRSSAPALLAGPTIAPVEPLAAPSAPSAPPEPEGPRSAPLRSGFYNPMPGGVMAGYQADTGLDIAGSPRPVYALASGTLDYSEPGHTLWTGASDTANCARFELDAPIPWKGRRITHVYYAHLSRLEHLQPEGATPRRHVEAGELLGRSGVANHSPHLHIGLLLDGEVEQTWGTFLLADEIRRVLGGYRNGDILPKQQ
jgi:murein DD-endopeptidase MepM/ murein hydrolase activator NlpD